MVQTLQSTNPFEWPCPRLWTGYGVVTARSKPTYSVMSVILGMVMPVILGIVMSAILGIVMPVILSMVMLNR